MSNFTPRAFHSEHEHDCQICTARHNIEHAMDAMSRGINSLMHRYLVSGGMNTLLASAFIRLQEALQGLHCDYRVSVNTNFCIWFGAEQHKRTKDVPELLRAYDEYRNVTIQSVQKFEAAYATVRDQNTSRLDLTSLYQPYHHLMTAVDKYWQTVDPWTSQRRQEALPNS